jgi:hypothetical protein
MTAHEEAQEMVRESGFDVATKRAFKNAITATNGGTAKYWWRVVQFIRSAWHDAQQVRP